MENINFEYIWKMLIKKSVDNILASLSDEEIEKYNVFIRDEKDIKKQVNRDYEAQKNLLKKRYHDGSISSGRIDQHKIAACICDSLIKNKIISFRLSEDLPPTILFANYKVAYNSSVGIIYCYLLDFYSSNDDDKRFEFLKERQSFFLPNTTIMFN